MCKVLVLDETSKAALSAPNPREERKLGDLLDQGYRLACQALVCGDATITIPEDPLKAIVRAKLANMEQEDLW
jgi:2Fe-2S ferredoxin